MPFEKGKSGNPKTQFKPGQSGNPDGKPKGLKNWSTLVREVLDDGEILDKLIKDTEAESKLPAWFSKIEDKRMGFVIVLAMGLQAMSGDVSAAAWLRKTGYGDKLDLTSDEKPVKFLAVLDMTPDDEKPKAKPKKAKKGKAVDKGNKPKAKRSISAGKKQKPKSKKA